MSGSIVASCRWVSLLRLIFVIVLLFAVFCCIAEQPPAVSGLAQGVIEHDGKIDVIYVSGSYPKMGEQYGRLERARLKALSAWVHDYTIKQKHDSKGDLDAIANKVYAGYPERFKAYYRGMAKGSHLSLMQLKRINAIEYAIFLPEFKDKAAPGRCSFMAVWGENSTCGCALLGRNYDFPERIAALNPYWTLTVLSPSDGEIPTAFFTLLGTLNATTILNASGLFVELNAGPMGVQSFDLSQTVAPAQLLTMAMNARTIADFREQIAAHRPNCDYIINAADDAKAVSFEWSSAKLIERPVNAPGLLVSTNSYQSKRWPSTLKDFATSIQRQNRLLVEGSEMTPFNLPGMKAVFDNPYQAGGVSFLGDGGGGGAHTMYQMVAMPGDRSLWVKIPGYQPWQKILVRFPSIA